MLMQIKEAAAKYYKERDAFEHAVRWSDSGIDGVDRASLDAAVKGMMLAVMATAFPHGCQSAACSTQLLGSKDWTCTTCRCRAEIDKYLLEIKENVDDAD